MSMRFGKTEIAAMVEAIDQDHESVEVAAKTALAVAEETFEKRAKFVVVGQLVSTKERGRIPASDPEAVKVSLGWYSTEGDAIKAAESLWTNTASGDQFLCWILPVFHGTPAELHGKQREKYAEAEASRKEKAKERMLQSIQARQREAQERANGGKGSCEMCAHQSFDHGRDGSSRGRCLLGDCKCPKWKEKVK